MKWKVAQWKALSISLRVKTRVETPAQLRVTGVTSGQEVDPAAGTKAEIVVPVEGSLTWVEASGKPRVGLFTPFRLVAAFEMSFTTIAEVEAGALVLIFVNVPEDGLLRPEHIRVLGGASGTTVSEMDNASGGPKGTAMSQVSGRSSPGGVSIQSNGALGLSRGGDGRDAAYVTYPVATLSAANLSMIEEERNRLSGYNRSPSPNFRQPMQHDPEDFFPPRASGPQRQYTDDSIREYNDGRQPWDPSSRFPPPAPSIRSQASSYAPPPPIKSPRAGSYPWPNRPVPAKITMPPLLSAQSPTPSSRGGIAGIGAGGGVHRRAMSATALSPGLPPLHHSFASPIPPASARLVCIL
jgi:hypothetical protein